MDQIHQGAQPYAGIGDAVRQNHVVVQLGKDGTAHPVGAVHSHVGHCKKDL